MQVTSRPPYRWACLVTSFPSALPTILTLLIIRPDEIDYGRARGAKEGGEGAKPAEARELLKDRPLIVFLACAVMFHFANAAMLPLLGEMPAKGKGRSSMLFMSACVVTTQLVITSLASWAGRKAGLWGRKLCCSSPLGPFRFAPFSTPLLTTRWRWSRSRSWMAWRLEYSVLVVADLTQGSGRFNLTLGAIGTAVGIGASLSQVIAGSIVHHFGYDRGFLFLAAVAAVALGILYFFMPETRDKHFPNPTPGAATV